MPPITKLQHHARIDETVRALADLGAVEGRRQMREKYHWSAPTYARYLAAAVERMRSAALCPDAERMRLIEATQRAFTDPRCTPHARIQGLRLIAQLEGALVERVALDARNTTLTIDARVAALLEHQEALQRVLAQDMRFLGPPEPAGAQNGCPGAGAGVAPRIAPQELTEPPAGEDMSK